MGWKACKIGKVRKIFQQTWIYVSNEPKSVLVWEFDDCVMIYFYLSLSFISISFVSVDSWLVSVFSINILSFL